MADDRIRVLFMIGYLADTGGAERFTTALATHLPRDRFEPWVCFTRGAEPGALRELRDGGVPHVGLGRRAKWDVHRVGRLVPLLRRERFDVLHTHMFGSNLWGSLIGRACRVPVVIAHEHTWSYEGNPLRAWLDGHVTGQLVTRFVAVSDDDADRMVGYEHVPAAKVIVMPTAYIPRAGATTSDIRAELGLGESAPVVATAVLLRPQKALDVLLAAHALVLARIPDAQLVIAGDGELRSELEHLADRLGLDGNVHFLGSRQDVDAILGSADVAALSSDFEGMPLFAFECMANHTPLVATAVGGVRSLIVDGESGILVPRRNATALADALVELLTNAPLRAEMARAAERRLAPYRIETVAAEFARLYEQLIAEARG
jgi:glycosyltransferase involved in cell wall biosynthesis